MYGTRHNFCNASSELEHCDIFSYHFCTLTRREKTKNTRLKRDEGQTRPIMVNFHANGLILYPAELRIVDLIYNQKNKTFFYTFVFSLDATTGKQKCIQSLCFEMYLRTSTFPLRPGFFLIWLP